MTYRKNLIIVFCFVMLFSTSFGTVCSYPTSAESSSADQNPTYYQLNITGLESDKYFIGYAIVRVTSSSGSDIFYGRVFNISLVKTSPNSLPDCNLTINYSFPFGKLDTIYPEWDPHKSNQQENATSANWSLPHGVYKISCWVPGETIIEGHKKGGLAAFERTIDLQSNANISLYFTFEPTDKTYSEGELVIIESLTTNSLPFFILFTLFVGCGMFCGNILLNKNRGVLAFVITYIPLLVLIIIYIYLLPSFSHGRIPWNDEIIVKDIESFDTFLSIFSVLCVFGYAGLSYRMHRRYEKLGMDNLRFISLMMAGILSFGLLVMITGILLESSTEVMCYAPARTLPPSPLKPKVLAFLGILSTKKILEKMHSENNIDAGTYEKIKRIIKK